ncbi:cytochrome P450 [Clohesyomyces aquaticus]|uniref:Cytochrome P450 n=1 Tax=Clohesyomyces aquaticus TaxID=1231657 RepID=A0A1Y1ZMR6_9PLEO|nr:cytochrome P450 [Clohesyomyces aquaticus]
MPDFDSCITTPSNAISLLLSIAIVYYISLGFYRLFLCPVARVPGPFLGKITYCYEFYHDVIRGGQYTFILPELHRKYGPIVRINPHEVHISDPEFYDLLYTGTHKKRDKWSWFTDAFGIPDSTFSAEKHDVHRVRRAALNPYFSKAKVRSLQPQIEHVVNKLLDRFAGFRKTGEPIPMSLAFAALTNDIAMQYAFGRNEKRIEAENFDPSFHDASVAGSVASHLIKQFPWILSTMQSLPDSVVVKLSPDMGSYVKMQSDIRHQINLIQADPHKKNSTSDKAQETIFHQILNSDLPAQEKSMSRLWQDGQVTVLAGTITTAAALSFALYHILDQPTITRKLKEELGTVMKDKDAFPPSTALEQLPYFTGCIKEALRLSNGVSHRLQRISPNEPIIFEDKSTRKQMVIPPGTPMSMTGYLIHMDPALFENPKEFNPQRWLDNPRLDRYLVAFSRGTRQCLGMNLGYAELYLTLAGIFRRYGTKDVRFPEDEGYIELFETDHRDVEIAADFVIPLAYKGSKGVRVVVHDF